MVYNLMKALFQCSVVVRYVNEALGIIGDERVDIATPWQSPRFPLTCAVLVLSSQVINLEKEQGGATKISKGKD